MTIDTIVTDLDDTLLDGSGQLSGYTLEVMAEVKRRGIRLIPCSGRTHASMYPFVAKLDTGLPYIGGNGSEIVGADHRLIEQLTLDVELAREICAFLTENGLYVQVYTDEAFYYSVECDIARRYKQSSGMKGVAVGDVCAFLSFATPKVLSVGEPEDVLRLMPLANERFRGRATFTMSKPYFLEAEPPGATKGEALLRLADHIGIVPEPLLEYRTAPASSNIQSMDKRLSLMRFIIEKHLPSYQAHLADALLGVEAASIQRLSGWEAEIRQSLQDRQPLSDASRDFLAHPSYGDGGMAAAVRLRSEIPDNA